MKHMISNRKVVLWRKNKRINMVGSNDNNRKIREANEKVDEIYIKYHDYIDSVARRYLKDIHMAEDAIQNTYESIIRKIETISCENTESTKRLLYKITRNHAFNLYRKNKKDRQNLDIIKDNYYIYWNKEENNTDEILIQEDHEEWMEYLNSNLSKLYAQVIIYKFYYQYSYPEIADIMNVTIETTRKRVERAKRKLAAIYIK